MADGWREPRPQPPPDDTVRDEEIEVELRAGRDAAAALLYRRKNGVGLAEAKAAIEAWRARLCAFSPRPVRPSSEAASGFTRRQKRTARAPG